MTRRFRVGAAPTVSIVMPAYNAGRWIGYAIDSLLRQTLDDFEIIVVDDGSTDATRDVVAAFTDFRLRLHILPRFRGRMCNRGMDAARGEFIAMMDADDVATPDRLERQVALLRARPDIGLCGGWLRTFGTREGVWSTYEVHEDIKVDLLFRCAFNQNTVTFRAALMRQHKLRYDSAFRVAQDYEMWTRCVDLIKVANLPAVLAEYRIHDGNESVRNAGESAATARRIRERQLAKLGLQPSAAELELHHALGTYGPSGARAAAFDVTALAAWLLRLREANLRSGYVSDRAMMLMLYEYWRRCCKKPAGLLRFPALRFLTAPLASGVPAARRAKDAMKIVLHRPLYTLPRGAIAD